MRINKAKSYTKYLVFHTEKRRGYINITDEIASAVAEGSIKGGLALVSAMRITAVVYVNNAEEGLIIIKRCGPSRTGGSTLEPGDRSITLNLMESGANE